MNLYFHHLDKWLSANIDLIEENLEKNNKTVVFLSGASSSGKSYCAKMLETALKEKKLRACLISLDSYNVGISSIIPNKVNLHYFQSRLENLPQIEKIIKDIIIDVDFDDKYKPEVLEKIKLAISSLLTEEELNIFISALPMEWAKLNFDEPTVYDMKEAADDVKLLLQGKKVEKKEYSKVYSERVPSGTVLNGNDYDVILIEGIYALDPSLISLFSDMDIITNFIDGNPKSLFLRRIIRDLTLTSAPTAFTMAAYFKYIIPSYLSQILPYRSQANVVFVNDMTFNEMKSGELFTSRYEIRSDNELALDKFLSSATLVKTVYEKDTYFSCEGEKTNKNTLRLRCISDDEGRTYYPTSLVHKGVPKVRKDGKKIRPFNILIKEGEFNKVWKDEAHCLSDFSSAGFLIGPIRYKIKYFLLYKGQPLTIRKIDNKGIYIEFDTPESEKMLEEVQSYFNS